jgi:hypothetical protein
MEYRNMKQSDTRTAENLKSEYAYANICAQYVGLAYRCDCTDNAKPVQRWTLAIDRRRCDAMTLGYPMRKGMELPGSASRISDSTRAESDGEKRQMLSSVEQKMDTRRSSVS